MLKQISFLLITSLTLLMYSCDEKDCCGPIYPKPTPELFIFGTFYGECAGPKCVTIFKIENEKLYEDTIDVVPYHGFLNGEFVQLPDSKYQLAKELVQKLPDLLLTDKKHVYGCPDCGDWGGIYFEIKIDSLHKSWLIDLMNTDLPADLIPFKDEIKRTVGMIR